VFVVSKRSVHKGNYELMQLIVNGTTETYPAAALTITELLKLAQVESPEMVSVQLNGEFVERANYGNASLKENDEVDFLYFMGGGAR
jgi:sulfur carrier protein